MEGLKRELQDILHEILLDRPEGISEYDLLCDLRARGVPRFVEGEFHDNLSLFRTHFLLFHLLYTLRDRLREEEAGDLIIHCLGIRIIPFSPGRGTRLPDVADPLRAYYLDPANGERVDRRTVDAMLEEFWRRFRAWSCRAGHLATLGLDGDASREKIRKRYRELALRHHPDRGGDAERFRAISEAAAGLLT